MPSLDAARLSRALNTYAADMEPLADFLSRYFTSLQAKGFTRDEALQLTRDLEVSLLRIITRD